MKRSFPVLLTGAFCVTALPIFAQQQVPQTPAQNPNQPAVSPQQNLPSDIQNPNIQIQSPNIPVQNQPQFQNQQQQFQNQQQQVQGANAQPVQGQVIQPQQPAVPATTVMTAEELAALTSEGLEDPFATTAASAAARNSVNAQRAANGFSLAGVIHVGNAKIAAVRESNARGQRGASIQYISTQGESTLKLPSQPDLSLRVIDINVSSVTLEVDGSSEPVTLR